MQSIRTVTRLDHDPAAVARRVIRQQVLCDVDVAVEQAGGLYAYLYTAPAGEIARMRRKLHDASTGARPQASDGLAARQDGERILALARVLGHEREQRDLLEGEAFNGRGDAAHRFPADMQHAVQKELAGRLAFHRAQVESVGYDPDLRVDHLHAAERAATHLLAQQLDAHDRGLAVYPSTDTQPMLGEVLYSRAASELASLRRAGRTADASSVLGGLRTRDPYLLGALDSHRQARLRAPTADQGNAATLLEIDRAVSMAVHGDPAAGRSSSIGSRASEAGRASRLRSNVAGAQPLSLTPARDRYYQDRVSAAATGMLLAQPRMRAAVELLDLKRSYAAATSTALSHAPAGRRRLPWRQRQAPSRTPRERALAANLARQRQLTSRLGASTGPLLEQARTLLDTRRQMLERTLLVRGQALAEEIGRRPKWLTATLGQRPDRGLQACRWDQLAERLASNRLRYMVTDDADPGIRPDQNTLTEEIQAFRARQQARSAISLEPTVAVGM